MSIVLDCFDMDFHFDVLSLGLGSIDRRYRQAERKPGCTLEIVPHKWPWVVKRIGVAPLVQGFSLLPREIALAVVLCVGPLTAAPAPARSRGHADPTACRPAMSGHPHQAHPR